MAQAFISHRAVTLKDMLSAALPMQEGVVWLIARALAFSTHSAMADITLEE